MLPSRGIQLEHFMVTRKETLLCYTNGSQKDSTNLTCKRTFTEDIDINLFNPSGKYTLFR